MLPGCICETEMFCVDTSRYINTCKAWIGIQHCAHIDISDSFYAAFISWHLWLVHIYECGDFFCIDLVAFYDFANVCPLKPICALGCSVARDPFVSKLEASSKSHKAIA